MSRTDSLAVAPQFALHVQYQWLTCSQRELGMCNTPTHTLIAVFWPQGPPDGSRHHSMSLQNV